MRLTNGAKTIKPTKLFEPWWGFTIDLSSIYEIYYLPAESDEYVSLPGRITVNGNQYLNVSAEDYMRLRDAAIAYNSTEESH